MIKLRRLLSLPSYQHIEIFLETDTGYLDIQNARNFLGSAIVQANLRRVCAEAYRRIDVNSG